MGECYGACVGEESPTAYNERAEEAKVHLTKVFENHFILITEGRNSEENGVIWVSQKKLFWIWVHGCILCLNICT